MTKNIPLLASALLGLGLTASAQPNRDYNNRNSYDVIPSGTEVRVRTIDRIDTQVPSDRRVYNGVVADDVIGRDGRVMIPRGANAELMVTNMGDREVAVDLESVSVNGRRYMVSAEDYTRARREGVGKNERTAKYVGGGALLGTVLGAIAGGGKGAAIGAIAGGAAGAGTQVLTRGNAVHIPSESILTFRLDRPLNVANGNYSRDRGVDRNGYHYHDDYYHDYRNDDTYRTDPRPRP